jgi:hypothetical protein
MSLGIATGYGKGGRDFNLGKGKVLLYAIRSRPTLWLNQPPVLVLTRTIYPRAKREERDADHISRYVKDILLN